jgi:hypothetical protein
MKVNTRGLTVHFNDGSKMTLSFPEQTQNKVAAQLKLENVLKQRYAMFEAEDTLLLIPFENVKYIQLYPAPENITGHTYVKGASITS